MLRAFFTAVVTAFLAVTAQSARSAEGVTDALAKFRAERAEAAKTFRPEELAPADELADRADAALKAGDPAVATRLVRDARWQLPFLPQNLPPHVARVLGVTRLRHADRVNAVAFSPDGTRLASASRDGTVRLWDLGNGRELLTYRGHDVPEAEAEKTNVLRVPAVAFSPDGRWVASSGSGDVHIWDPSSGKQLFTLRGHKQPCRGLVFVDANTLVSGGDDRRVIVWDVTAEKPRFEYPEQSQRVEAVAVGAKGKLVATVNAAGELLVYALDGKNRAPVMTAHVTDAGQPGFGVGFAGDAGIVVAGGDDTAKLVPIPDLSASAPAPVATLRTYTGHTAKVNSLAISPDGKTLVTVGKDSKVRLWEVGTGKTVRAFQGHATQVTAVAVSPDGTRIASGGEDGQVRLWPLAMTDDHRSVSDAGDALWALAVSPDGKRFAAAGADRIIRVYRNDGAKQERSLIGHKSPVPALTFVGNEHLASGSGDKLAKIWDLATGAAKDCVGHTSAVLGVASDAAGVLLVTGSADKTVRGWDVATAKLRWTWTGKSAVCTVAVRKDGRRVAVGTASGELIILQPRDGGDPGVVAELSAHGAGVAGVCFHPDGTRVATCGGDGAVRVWSVPDTGDVTRMTVIGPTGTAADGKSGPPPAAAVAYSADGRLLAFGGADAITRIWDTQTNTEIRGFRGHADWVTAVAFAPDGKAIFSAGTDKAVRVFDVARTEAIGSGHALPVRCLAIRRDGQLLATGSEDSTVKVWDLSTGREMATLAGSDKPVNAVGFAGPNVVVAGGDDRRVRWWALPGGREVRSAPTGKVFVLAAAADGSRVAVVWNLEGEKTAGLEVFGTDGTDPTLVKDQGRDLSSAVVSADATLTITGGEDGVLRVWNLTTRERVGGDWPLFVKRVVDLALTADQKTLVAIDESGTVKVADVAAREAGVAIPAVTGEVRGLVLSPTGDKFATLASDGTVTAWTLKGAVLRTWKLPAGPAVAAFTPDGAKLVTGNRDGTAYVLQLP